MNQPTTFQRSSSWTFQSYIKSKDTTQDDDNDDNVAVPKTEFLRGFSELMDTSASFDVLPHQVENQVSSTKTSVAAKRFSIISSASETDSRSYESEDDDGWIDALCDVPVAMFDSSIEPLPSFQDVLNSNNNSRKRSADDMHFPSADMTPAGHTIAHRRVSMDSFLPTNHPGKQISNNLKTPPPATPKKKAPPPPPSRPTTSLEANFQSAKLARSVSPSTNNYKPSKLFSNETLESTTTAIKQEPNVKMIPAEAPFPNVSSSGRVRKAVKMFDPQEYQVPRKPRKTKPAIKDEQDSINTSSGNNNVQKEPSKKKRKTEKSNKAESDPLANVRIPRKSGSSNKAAKTSKKNGPSKSSRRGRKKAKGLKATKGLKVVKAGRTIRSKKGSLFIVTPTKVKSTNIPVPLNLSDIPKINKVKVFSDVQEESWTQKYQEFLDFKELYGHTAVPHFYYPNLKLSRWVKRQRYQYKLRLASLPSTMTDKRIIMLNKAGFIWDSHATVWMERYRELSAFVDKHGHASVASRNKNKRTNCLAAWVKHQRRQYKLLQMGCSSHMTTERIDLLDKINFQWVVRGTPGIPIRTRTRARLEEFHVDDVEDIQPDVVESNGML